MTFKVFLKHSLGKNFVRHITTEFKDFLIQNEHPRQLLVFLMREGEPYKITSPIGKRKNKLKLVLNIIYFNPNKAGLFEGSFSWEGGG